MYVCAYVSEYCVGVASHSIIGVSLSKFMWFKCLGHVCNKYVDLFLGYVFKSLFGSFM